MEIPPFRRGSRDLASHLKSKGRDLRLRPWFLHHQLISPRKLGPSSPDDSDTFCPDRCVSSFAGDLISTPGPLEGPAWLLPPGQLWTSPWPPSDTPGALHLPHLTGRVLHSTYELMYIWGEALGPGEGHSIPTHPPTPATGQAGLYRGLILLGKAPTQEGCTPRVMDALPYVCPTQKTVSGSIGGGRKRPSWGHRGP